MMHELNKSITLILYSVHLLFLYVYFFTTSFAKISASLWLFTTNWLVNQRIGLVGFIRDLLRKLYLLEEVFFIKAAAFKHYCLESGGI